MNYLELVNGKDIMETMGSSVSNWKTLAKAR